MNTSYLPLIFLFSTAFIYKTLFWLYVIQLKEYRWDRCKEYSRTGQGKAALFNFWFLLESCMLGLSFFLFLDGNLERMFGSMVFVFLILENIFVAGKILRKNMFFPKKTGRLLLTSSIYILIFVLLIFLQLHVQHSAYIYIIIFGSFILVPVFIFISIFLSLPVVNSIKQKKISQATKKSNAFPKVIKVGITGSFGKSSVKTYLSQILASKDSTLATPENINSELGVSNIVLKTLTNKYKYFVAEMGAYRIGEIALLGDIVNHKHAFLTGIGNQHLGLFGSIENTKKGKFEILEKVLKNGGRLYLNYDNFHIQNYLNEQKIPDENIVKYGLLENKNDAKSQIQSIQNGITQFSFYYHEEKYNFETILIGSHNVLNLTGIIAFCFDEGLSYEEIQAGLKCVTPPKHTLEIHKLQDTICIDDSYNLSEDGLYAGLDAASSFGDKMKIYLVLDDILELGGSAEKKHTEITKNILKNYSIEKIFFTGKNYKKNIMQGLKEIGQENVLQKKFEFIPDSKTLYLFEGRGTSYYFKNCLEI